MLIVFTATLISCEDSTRLPALPPGAEAISLLGDTLRTPSLSPDLFDEYNRNLLEAVMEYRVDPEEMDALIWLGRRTAYMGLYRDAVRIYTEGIFKKPEDPRLYRHRGHRYLTLRKFDLAIDDFKMAEILMRGSEDQTEPDGLPNAAGVPQSTLKSNVWYHMGLAHYLKGDFENAVESYRKALELDLTNDMRIAVLYWYYSSLKRLGMDADAGRLIAEVSEEIELFENQTYLNLLLVFKGVFDSDYLMEVEEDAVQNATLGYGLGNWHLMNGREERAFKIWEEIVKEGFWPAFGYIAAEAEIARIRG
ncbi:MAG: tetratricopeptide repeat protein [Balneolaceae bacterium]|nr:MAG: tetratricopeptide repeat protein [Balneolaceae bacterium]